MLGKENCEKNMKIEMFNILGIPKGDFYLEGSRGR